MARHRSPQGRRTRLGLPLPAMSVAGPGGGVRMPSLALPGAAPLPVRVVAWAVAGSAVAATGQMILSEALPLADQSANMLRVGVTGLFDPVAGATEATALPVVAEPITAVDVVAAEPAVADAAGLVKSAELNRLAAEAAEAARVAEEARLAEEARVAAEAAAAAAAVTASGGGIQMIVGRITSGFGSRWGTSHQGLDIAAPIGTPIRVPLDGTVIDSGPASGFGLWVRVRHDDGTITVYGHINRSLVSVGQRVSAGEEIAEVGNRGQSTGPHLHVEVITPGGSKIDPRPWLAERGIGVT